MKTKQRNKVKSEEQKRKVAIAILGMIFYLMCISLYFIESVPYYAFVALILAMGLIMYICERNMRIKKDEITIEKRVKRIFVEILKFIPFGFLVILYSLIFIKGVSENQRLINEERARDPIFSIISVCIIAPIIEEIVFRYFPSKFLKNKVLYVIIATIVFAWMHVSSDPNPFYYIWAYVPISFYLAYRYAKTEDIFVTLAIHVFYNLVPEIVLNLL